MANLIKSGGTIVYSTCTLEPRENEELIYKFLDENKGKFKIIVPQQGNLEPFREGEFLKTYPDVHEMEGSFAAKLQFLG